MKSWINISTINRLEHCDFFTWIWRVTFNAWLELTWCNVCLEAYARTSLSFALFTFALACLCSFIVCLCVCENVWACERAYVCVYVWNIWKYNNGDNSCELKFGKSMRANETVISGKLCQKMFPHSRPLFLVFLKTQLKCSESHCCCALKITHKID